MDRCKLLRANFALITLFAITGCQKDSFSPPPQKPLPVSTIVAHPSDEPHWIEVLGQAEGGREVEVRAQVSGLLEAIHYKEGDLIRKGELMFQIDDSPFQAKYEAARAASAQASSDLEQAEREFKRNTALLKAGAVSQKVYDDSLSLRNQLRHALASAKANEQEALINLKWTQVLAPATGYAERATLNPGALVSSSTSLLTTISQHDDLRVIFAPSDKDLAGHSITFDNQVRLFRSDGSELKGQLDYVAQSIDPELGSRSMRARVEDPKSLLPGEFVRVRLMTDIENNVFRIPQKAVVQRPDGSYAVYLVKNNKAEARTVEVGLWEGSDWIIRKGLTDGDIVITNQLIRLRDGVSVSPSDSQDAH